MEYLLLGWLCLITVRSETIASITNNKIFIFINYDNYISNWNFDDDFINNFDNKTTTEDIDYNNSYYHKWEFDDNFIHDSETEATKEDNDYDDYIYNSWEFNDDFINDLETKTTKKDDSDDFPYDNVNYCQLVEYNLTLLQHNNDDLNEHLIIARNIFLSLFDLKS